MPPPEWLFTDVIDDSSEYNCVAIFGRRKSCYRSLLELVVFYAPSPLARYSKVMIHRVTVASFAAHRPLQNLHRVNCCTVYSEQDNRAAWLRFVQRNNMLSQLTRLPIPGVSLYLTSRSAPRHMGGVQY